MGLSSRFLRTPKPRKFLGLLSLSTGASLITLSLLLNKLSGFYGILALLTGYHLSPFQLSMYIYSLAALILTVILIPHIKTQSPLHCIALAWFYVLDSIINAAYTAAFAVTWFLVLLQHQAGKDAGIKGPGASTVNDTAGFTNPEHNVTRVEVIATPQAGDYTPGSGQDAVVVGAPGDAPAGVGGDVILGRESINSIGIIIVLWTIRAYFCLVMLSWARMVLRQHIAIANASNPHTDFTTTSEKGQAEDPFAESKPEGQGWKGKLGRFMISLGRSYWLGSEDGDNSWMNTMPDRFRSSRTERAHSTQSAYQAGTGIVLGKIEARQNSERERRRRSGTGPPLPSVQAQAGVISDGEEGVSDGASGSSLLSAKERAGV